MLQYKKQHGRSLGFFYVWLIDADFDDFGEQDEFVSIQAQTKAPQAEASARGES